MIYLTSDPHGGDNTRGIRQYLEVGTASDLLIILGDLGLRFQDTKENQAFDRWFLSLDRPMAVLDGNHENFPCLNSFPCEQWCGGTVRRLSENAVYLQRGNVYQIAGKRFFVMGGCKSSAKWKEMGLWYEGEEPSPEEISLAYDNLKRCGNRVDYILTHKYDPVPSASVIPALTLEGLTKYIDETVDFQHWYAGHGHVSARCDARHTWVYDELVRLP